jgi:sugar phosphate isomerase/epimerase
MTRAVAARTAESNSVHQRLSVNSICFPGAAFHTVAEHWRALGVRRISMVSHEVLNADIPAIKGLLEAGNWACETICHPFLPFRPLQARAESGLEARATLSRLIQVAAKLEVRSIYMLTGGHGSLTWEQAATTFSTAIAPCVAQAREVGIALAVENSSVLYADNHIAHSLRDTLVLAEMAGIGVCMDLYACWAEAGLAELIERALPQLHVVQVSDYVYGDRALPCRAVPGDGAVPLRRILEWLLRAGYAGAFDLELIGPRIDQEGHRNAARRASQYVGEMLRALGA